MASSAIIGLPGGGKSLYATETLANELVTTSRNIVTNIPLNREAVEAYAAKRHVYDVWDRLVLLDPLDFDLAKQFYLYRTPEITLAHFPESFKAVATSNFHELFGKGTTYYLDEVHQFLNSREWQATGKNILRYLSMHRHFSDEVFWMTQAPSNVDRQWRSLTQSYFECRNFGLEAFRGFSKGKTFQVRETLNLPSPTNSESPQSVRNLPLNIEVANLYKTSALGGEADKGRSKKGMHYSVLVYAFAAVASLIAYGIYHYAHKAGQIFSPVPTKVEAKIEKKPEKEEKNIYQEQFDNVLHRADGYAPAGYLPTASRGYSVREGTKAEKQYALPPLPTACPSEDIPIAWERVSKYDKNGNIRPATLIFDNGHTATEGGYTPSGLLIVRSTPHSVIYADPSGRTYRATTGQTKVPDQSPLQDVAFPKIKPNQENEKKPFVIIPS